MKNQVNSFSKSHPIITQEYAIFTPPMEHMIKTIGDWIDQRVSGGYIYGPSRFGKFRTLKWFLRHELEQRYNCYIPLIIWIRKDSAMSEGEFWNQLLEASKYELSDPIKPKTKVVARSLFEKRIKTIADFSECNYVVLVIDEAHEVTLKEWKWLLGLQNNLDNEGIRLSIFSIASHSILFQPNYLARTGNPHIAARFFAVDMRFDGIKRMKELHYILQGYEEDSEWPENSNITYFQYFAPNFYKEGKRLSNHTAIIWGAFESLFPVELDVRKRTKISLEIPMQHIALTIEKVLRNLLNADSWDHIEDPNYWIEVIASTGFSKHMKMIVNPA